MIKEIRLPEIADNIDDGDIIKVLVSVGDMVDVDTPIVELASIDAPLNLGLNDTHGDHVGRAYAGCVLPLCHQCL